MKDSMNKKIFLVQGSAAEPYKVTFIKKNDNLSSRCTCPAGEKGIYCKHRFNIMYGIADAVVSPNKDDVILIKSWLSGTEVEAALNEVLEKEKLLDMASQALSLAKKKLAKAMRD